MKKQKLIPIVILLSLIVLVSIPFASADTYLASNAGGVGSTIALMTDSPSAIFGEYGDIGQTFNVTTSGHIGEIWVNAINGGTDSANCDGTLTMYIYSTTGTYGSTMTPSTEPATSVLATSTNTFDIGDSLNAATYTLLRFEFNDYEVTADDKVCFAICVSDSNLTGTTRYVNIRASSSSTYSGNVVGYKNSAWNTVAQDLEFYVIDSYIAPTPTPSPSPAPTVIGDVTFVWNGTAYVLPSGNWLDNTFGTDEDSGIAWLNDTVPFIVPLLILFGGGGLGWYLTGKRGFIGFFIGINAAAIICYAVMPTVFPLWAVIALIMVDAVLVFNAVRSQGGGE